MSASGYTIISMGMVNINLSSTDASVVKWGAEEMVKLLPNFAASTSTLPNGELYACIVKSKELEAMDLVRDSAQVVRDELSEQIRATVWFMVGQLCERGWEPFLAEKEKLYLRYVG